MGGCILVRSSPFDPDDTNTAEERQKWRPQQMGHVGCELLQCGNELCTSLWITRSGAFSSNVKELV